SQTLTAAPLKTTALGQAALKTGSKGSFTARNSAFSPVLTRCVRPSGQPSAVLQLVVAPFLTFARYVFSRSARDDSQVSRPTERGKCYEHSTSSYSYESLGPLGGSRPWLVQHRPGRSAVAGGAAGVANYRDSGQRTNDPRLRRARDRY